MTDVVPVVLFSQIPKGTPSKRSPDTRRVADRCDVTGATLRVLAPYGSRKSFRSQQLMGTTFWSNFGPLIMGDRPILSGETRCLRSTFPENDPASAQQKPYRATYSHQRRFQMPTGTTGGWFLSTEPPNQKKGGLRLVFGSTSVVWDLKPIEKLSMFIVIKYAVATTAQSSTRFNDSKIITGDNQPSVRVSIRLCNSVYP